jgi:hemerythrin-like metal-binding protein
MSSHALNKASVLETTDNIDIAGDHARLSSLIDQIVSAMGARPHDYNVILNLLQEILEEASDHFRREEKIMERKDYPGRFTHESNHKYLEKCLGDYIKLYQLGFPAINNNVASSIYGWFSFHTKTWDGEFLEWLNARGDARV